MIASGACVAIALLLLLASVRTTCAADDTLFRRADAAFRRGHLDSATALVQPVLERALASGDSQTVVRARIVRASAWAMGGRASEAESESALAYEWARSLVHPEAMRLALRWWAFSALQQGRLATAAERYDELARRAARAGDRLEAAYADMGLGYLALQADSLDVALSRYRRSVDGFVATSEPAMELEARIGLARTLRRVGDSVAMREQYRTVMSDAAREGNERAASIARNNLAVFEYEDGDPAVAIELWQQALDVSGDRLDTRRRILLGTNLVLARMQLGDFDRARQDATDLLVIARDDADAGATALVLSRLAAIDASSGRFAPARAMSLRLFDDAALDPAQRIDALRRAVMITERLDGPAAALGGLDERLSRLDFPLTRVLRAECSVLAARLALATADTQRAREEVRSARTAMLASDRVALRIDLALVRADLLRNADPDSAEAELRRGLQIWETARTRSGDPQWREEFGTHGQQLHLSLARLWMDEPVPRDLLASSRDERIARSFVLLATYKARTLAERVRGPSSPVGGRSSTDFDLDAFRRALAEQHAVFVDLHVASQGGLVFVVDGSRIECVAIPSTDVIEPKARLYRELVTQTQPTVRAELLTAAGDELAGLLFGPIRIAGAGIRTVLLAPDGFTHALPLELLVDARWPREHRDPPLVYRVPSAPMWTDLQLRNHRAGRRGVLAVEGAHTEELGGSGREIDGLPRRFRATRIARLDPVGAVASSLAEQSEGFAVLHVAGHGQARASRPWSARVDVASTDPDHTVLLEAAEIVAGPRTMPPLTVLSSCESAQGRVLRGEGVLGLTSAFLVAGSDAVVASLWPVDDATTVGLIETFYRELARGRTVAAALDRARARVRNQEASRLPVYWAGFVVVGDGGAKVDLDAAAIMEEWMWLLVGAVAVLVAVSVLGGRHRSRRRNSPEV